MKDDNSLLPVSPAAVKTLNDLAHHPLRSIWKNMRSRCLNSKSDFYHRYGGRGIGFHPRWNDFKSFIIDVTTEIGDRPNGTSIDRIDNDGDYEPGNIKWSSASEQMNNRCNNITMVIDGVKHTAAQAAVIIGIRASIILFRIHSGWSDEKIISTPPSSGSRSDNSSGFIGVSMIRRTGKWQARKTVNGKRISLGIFSSPEEAHAARIDATLT